MRWRTRILLVVGGLASIATSQAHWTAYGSGDLRPGTIDDTHLALRYVVHVEWNGSETPGSGELDASIDVQPGVEPTAPYNLIVETRDFRYPDVVTMTSAPIGAQTSVLSATLWDTCDTRSCAQDFEIVVRRPYAPGVIANVKGIVDGTTDGIGGTTPPGTQTITVTGPL